MLALSLLSNGISDILLLLLISIILLVLLISVILLLEAISVILLLLSVSYAGITMIIVTNQRSYCYSAITQRNCCYHYKYYQLLLLSLL